MASLEQDEIDKIIQQQEQKILADSVIEKLNELYKELFGGENPYGLRDMDGIKDYCKDVLDVMNDDDWRRMSIQRLKEQAEER